MKRTLFTLMLIIASVMAIQAQSLTGKSWAASLDDGEGHDIKMVMEFENGGECMVAVLAQLPMQEDGVKINISTDAAIPGSYAVSGKKLEMKLAKSNAKMDINVDMGSSGIPAANRKMAESMMKSELEKQKKELLNEIMEFIPNLNGATIKTITDSKLVLVDASGKEMEFAAVH